MDIQICGEAHLDHKYHRKIRSDQARIGGRLSEFENQLQREMPSADRGGRTGERRLSPTLQPPNRERTDVPNRWPGEYGTPFQTKSLVDDGGRRADGRKLSPTIPVDRGRTDERSDDIEGPPPINLPAEDQVRRSSGRRYSPEFTSRLWQPSNNEPVGERSQLDTNITKPLSTHLPVEGNPVPPAEFPNHDSVFGLESDEFSPYFYEPPPPPAVLRPLGNSSTQQIYVPEDASSWNLLLPPMVDQNEAPRYIRARYNKPRHNRNI
ncbi:unnamed protein product [Calicophoron daubneyi]|uniref:Uncharacterized protein n=1 Tax=Calicophoron daubneyi TaxID=300641 RepID=A0AAV2TK47_CALDB